MGETSIQAYKWIRPYLGKWHKDILDAMMSRTGSWTAREVRQYFIDEEIMAKDRCLSSSISARMVELRKLGHIIQSEKRECTISGRMSKACLVSMGDYRDMTSEEIQAELDREDVSRKMTMELFG